MPRGRQRDGRTARVQHAAGSRWHARMQRRQQTTGNGRSATCNATRNTPCNKCTTQHTACVPCSRQTTCNMERGLDERYLPRELRRSPKRLERRVKLQFARPAVCRRVNEWHPSQRHTYDCGAGSHEPMRRAHAGCFACAVTCTACGGCVGFRAYEMCASVCKEGRDVCARAEGRACMRACVHASEK